MLGRYKVDLKRCTRRTCLVYKEGMPEEATIQNNGGHVVVETAYDRNLEGLPGVEISAETKRCYKIFRNKRIYLPGDLDRAVAETLKGHDVLRIAMNGYSQLSSEHCATWGVRPGAYEQAVASLLEAVTRRVQHIFNGIDVRFLHGSSNMGVDASIMQVAKKMNRPNLGFSCPSFMFYVEDDDSPVYVAANQAAYADAFAKSTDILIACNGRAQALQHDLMAALLYGKEVVLVNVLRTISTTGGPSAIGPDGKIEDAVDAFLIRVHAVGQRLENGGNYDHWSRTVNEIMDVAAGICRQRLSPERAFQIVA